MPSLLIVTTVPITLRGFLCPFAEHFRARGWRVDAMAQNIPSIEPYLSTFDRLWNVNWSRNPLDWNNFLQTPAHVRRVVEREKYDLVHVHTPVAAFVTRYALRGMRRIGKPKIIYTAHGFHFHKGGSLLKNTAFLATEMLAGRWTDYMVVINKDDVVAARRFHLISSNYTSYIPGIGVDTSYYSSEMISYADMGGVRRELGLKESDHLFLMIAEFKPSKRHRDTLRAFSELQMPNVHLAFAGTGPLLDQMRQMACALGVQGRVHFLGFRNDVPLLIRTSIATLLPSEREGLPRSIMESLSLSVPVIGSDIRGIRDLLETGAGILIKVGDIKGLAQAMDWFVQHPNEAIAMGQKGREQMVNTYDLRLILKQHEDLYGQALGADL